MVSTLEKIQILGENGKYDICASTASSRSEIAPNLYGDSTSYIGQAARAGICHSYTPDGRCVSLFKVLFTNKCIYNCKYCFNTTCKTRVSFTPEEYARTFMKLYSMNVLEGLFISSGIAGDADETTKQMLKTVELIRFKYKFQGYIHFKCLPGTSGYLLKEAVKLADRISVNLEAPTKSQLESIAPQKNYDTDIITRQKWLKQIRKRHNYDAKKKIFDYLDDLPEQERKTISQFNPWVSSMLGKSKNKSLLNQTNHFNGYKSVRWDGAPFLNSGQTTQFVLGAADESDYDHLKRLDWGYREIDLRRGYFSAFSPIPGSPLENHPATSLAREHRLYQSDWLLRRYNFPLKEIKDIVDDEGFLPKGDPKKHMAIQYFGERGTVDPNTAKRQELLRVPGIGITSVNRIMRLRRQHEPITSREQMKEIGVVMKWADPYLKINGQTQNTLDRFITSPIELPRSYNFAISPINLFQEALS
ncbi:MAG: putative DNA modification/repair radical SAM protein [Promethearchaeota archaeon]